MVVEADSAGLLLSFGYAPYAEMQSLELWAGTKRRPWRGFKYGSIVGGTVGVATGVLHCACKLHEVVGAALGVGAVYGVVGGVVGALIGSAVKSDIWEPVVIPGGLSLRLAVGGRSPAGAW